MSILMLVVLKGSLASFDCPTVLRPMFFCACAATSNALLSLRISHFLFARYNCSREVLSPFHFAAIP